MTGIRAAPDWARAGEAHPALALLIERGHQRHPAAVVHLAFSDDPSFVGVHVADQELVPLITVLALPGTGTGVLDAVAGIDAAGRRLVDRFAVTYPEALARVSGVDSGVPTAAGLGWLLGLSSLLIDLQVDEVRQAVAGLDAWVRVETVVIEDQGVFVLDGRRLLRSVMSYRVAGVPSSVLAASVFTSLGEFTGDAVRRLLRAWPDARVIACSGDLFAGNALLRDRARLCLAGLRRPVLLP